MPAVWVVAVPVEPATVLPRTKEKCVVWCRRRLSDNDALFGDRHRGDVTHHGDQCGHYGEGYRGAAAVSAGRIDAVVEVSR